MKGQRVGTLSRGEMGKSKHNYNNALERMRNRRRKRDLMAAYVAKTTNPTEEDE